MTPRWAGQLDNRTDLRGRHARDVHKSRTLNAVVGGRPDQVIPTVYRFAQQPAQISDVLDGSMNARQVPLLASWLGSLRGAHDRSSGRIRTYAEV
jgi:hypothetical protein